MSAGYEQVLAIVLAQLASACGVERLDEEQRLGSLGLDSIEVTGLMASLGLQLERDLDPTLFWRFATASQLCRYLCNPEDNPATPVSSMPAHCAQPLAITGLACRFPGAEDSLAFWRLLKEGRSGVGPVGGSHFVEQSQSPWHVAPDEVGGFLDDTCEFDHERFGLSAHEASQMDPQQRLLLTLTWSALEQAGMPPATLRGQRGGVYVGAMWSDFAHHVAPQQMTAQSATGLDTSILSARISFTLGLNGPSLTVNTACSSSLVALHLACQALKQGECDFAIVGGVNLMLASHSFTAMRRFGGLSDTSQCHTFDADADGYVRAEGAGVVVLRRLPDALAAASPIWGVVRSSVVNNNGFHNSLTAPSMQAQQALLAEALRLADVAPGEVEYVEAHGTGTAMGDPIEATAIAAAYCPRGARQLPLLIGSVKTNIGHGEAAAGMAGLIKVLLALQHGVIPAHLNYQTPNPAIDWARLSLQPVLENTPWSSPQPLAGLSSFGFGGTNAHVIIGRQWPAVLPENNEEHCVDTSLSVLQPASRAPGAVLVFSGQGAQWQGMGLHLARLDPAFRASVARCDQMFMELAGWSLAERLYDSDETFSHVEVAWPCHFAVQVALAQVWIAKGLRPTAVIGHSIGEVAAAHVAGLLTLRDALRVILAQARWASRHPGAMALLELDWEPVRELLATLQVDASVAIQHSDQATVITGSVDAIESVQRHCLQRGIRLSRVRSEVAVHAEVDEQDYLSLCEAMEDIVPCSPHLTFHGGAGDWPSSTHYWADVVARPIRWFDALRTALRATDGVVVEVSSHPVLLGSLRRAIETCAPAGGFLISACRGGCDSTAMEQVLKHCCDVSPPPVATSPQVLLLCAHSHEALLARCTSIAQWIEHDVTLSLADCAQALRSVAGHERFRLAWVVDSREQAVVRLRSVSPQQLAANDVKPRSSPILRVSADTPFCVVQRNALLSLANFAGGYSRVMQIAEELGIEADSLESVATYIGCVELLRGEGILISHYQAGSVQGSVEDLLAGRSGLCVLVQAARDLVVEEPSERDAVGQQSDALLCFEGIKGGDAGLLLAELIARCFRAGTTLTSNFVLKQPPLVLPATRSTRFCAREGAANIHRLVWQPVEAVHSADCDSHGLLVIGHAASLLALQAHAGFARAQWYGLQLDRPHEQQRLAFIELLESEAFNRVVLLVESTGEGACLVASVLGLLQALREVRRVPPELHVMTCAAQRLPMDREVAPDASMLWGLLRTAQLELGDQCLCITDIEGWPVAKDPDRGIAHAVLASIGSPLSQSAWRAGVRYTPVLQSAMPEGAESQAVTVTLSNEGFHLITGGLGALGQAMLRWRIGQGERRFLLVGRRPPSTEVARAIEALRQQGAMIVVEALDVAEHRALAEAVERTATRLGPLTAISHGAGALHGGALEQMTLASFYDAVRAKRQGTWNLHRISLHWPVRRFLLVSSVSSLFGFPGHAAYASGNAYLDGLADYRMSQGLPATSAMFGPFNDQGLLATDEGQRVFEHLPGIDMEEGLRCLQQWGDRCGHPVIMCYRGPDALARSLPALRAHVGVMANTGDRHTQLCAIIGRFVASLLQIPAEHIPVDAPLSDLGVSSLLGVEIRNRLQTELHVRMPATVLWNYPTIEALATYLEPLLWPPGAEHGSRSEEETAPDDDALMAELLRELATIKDKFSGEVH
jgi:acyl transferase domain-containing protein/acyl carrier protein